MAQIPQSRTTEAARGPRRGTVAVVDAIEAAIRTEQLCSRGIWAATTERRPNAFGDESKRLGDDPKNAAAALASCAEIASAGGRAAAMISLAALVDARRRLAELVERRLPLVIHAVITLRDEPASVTAHADLHAIGDIGVAILVARDAQDAADLTVIAHRAAEDAETPVVVVHDGWPASYARDRVVLPDAPLVRAALEAAPSPLGPSSQGALAPHRRAAARIPFALSSSMRAFERLAARRMHSVEAIATETADVVLIAIGAVAESARATVEHLRGDANEPKLGLVQVIALRPFPGADIVKAVGRARGVAIVERADAPLSQSNPLATEVKAAFADALTWAPGYPGIGRIPTIFSACIDPAHREASPGEILAVVENALQGEQGRRAFRVGGEAAPDVLPASAERRVAPGDSVTLRWWGDPSLLLEVLVDLYGGHVRATPLGRDAFDVTLARGPVRAHHGASDLDLAVIDGGDAADALGHLREGGTVLVVGREKDLPSATKSALRARTKKVFAIETNEKEPRVRTATLCGAVLRAVAPAGLDRAQILVDAERAIHALGGDDAAALLAALTRGYDATTEPS
jgi:pyruvate/2-oxoacid:ferredoxin oxidoreductase alpha subunit